jgi:hypothetical protein
MAGPPARYSVRAENFQGLRAHPYFASKHFYSRTFVAPGDVQKLVDRVQYEQKVSNS